MDRDNLKEDIWEKIATLLDTYKSRTPTTSQAPSGELNMIMYFPLFNRYYTACHCRTTSPQTWAEFKKFFTITNKDSTKTLSVGDTIYIANQAQAIIQQEISSILVPPSEDDGNDASIMFPLTTSNTLTSASIKKIVVNLLAHRFGGRGEGGWYGGIHNIVKWSNGVPTVQGHNRDGKVINYFFRYGTTHKLKQNSKHVSTHVRSTRIPTPSLTSETWNKS